MQSEERRKEDAVRPRLEEICNPNDSNMLVRLDRVTHWTRYTGHFGSSGGGGV